MKNFQKKLKRIYRGACVAFGKKKVNACIVLALAAAVSVILQGLPSGPVPSQTDTAAATADRSREIVDELAGRLLNAAEHYEQGSIAYAEDNENRSSESIETAVITKVSDGDTIKVEMNGQEYKIRMLEVDTPESVHVDKTKNNAFGQEASAFTKENLKPGQTVYLTRDTSDTDRYGRLLRLVWTERPNDSYDAEELRTKCYNARLLLDGYAEVAIYDDDSYQDIFTEFQTEAMNDRRGLWADDAWWEFNGLQ